MKQCDLRIFLMESDVLLILLMCLSAASSGVIRNDVDYPQEEKPCITFTSDGLIYVDCSDRGLSSIPKGINEDVQVLDLSNNNFEYYPIELSRFLSLESINLSGNLLSTPLPALSINNSILHTLKLSNNNYEVWANNARYYSGVKVLDLSKNKINTIDKAAISDMEYLTFLDLSENRIYDLEPEIFDNMRYLNTLILSRNYFSFIPKFVSSSMKSLRLSNCQIMYINSDALERLTSLLEIDLSINQIENIPDSFASRSLQELDLSYNEIGSINDLTFSSLPHLAVLNLRGNEFKEVWSTSSFASNPFLRELHLKGNRWSCEGFSVNLLLTYEFMTKQPSKVSDTESLICYSPSNVTQMSWERAYIETWHSSETTESFTMVAVVIGIIIGVVITSFVCRGLMSFHKPDPPRPAMNDSALNLNGAGVTTQPRVETVVMSVPLHEDLPPSYDEALLMPRLNSSFHSLPDFVDVEPEDRRRHRRSRSIGDLIESRTRASDRRSVRRPTVEIHIN